MRKVGVLLLVLSWTAAAHAEDVEQAKALFAAGAAAYEQHDYVGAIRAFEGAEKAAPRPPIEFSLAQAHRRQFYVDGNVEHQKAAVDLFRDYVRQVPSGGRHEDAMRALQELGALSPQRDATSVSINSSGTPGARISLDGAPSVAAPLIQPATVGKHHTVISADGFVTEERDIVAVEGQIVALDVPLKEKQARIALTAPSGAAVSLDGRAVGETPLLTPLDVSSGAHILSLTKSGHEAYSHDLELARGEQRRIDVAMPVTKQRIIATSLLVTGGIAAIAGAAFAATAVTYLGMAQGILNKPQNQHQNLTLQDVSDYNYDKDARSTWLVATGITFASAAVLAATGLVLFVFDKPTATNAPAEEHKQTPTPRKTEPTDLAITPIVSPTLVGASALLRF